MRERGQIWTPGQVRAFLDTAKGHRLFAFYHLAVYTGACRGELLNLRWRDVDLAGAEVHITGSAAVVGGTRIEGTTKSGRSQTVSVDAGTIQVLKEREPAKLPWKQLGVEVVVESTGFFTEREGPKGR